MTLLWPGCRGRERELPVSDERIVAPYQEFENGTLNSYNGSLRKWRLESLYMRKPLGDTGTVLAVPVVLALFDSTGTTTSKILSDSGLTTPAMESFLIWGDVYVRTRENLVVRTERIALDAKTHMWHSDTFVEIHTAKGDVLRGKGFDASESFSTSTFRRSVSGQFPQFRERMEQDDEFF